MLSCWLLQEKLSEQLEEQRQEQALQRYHSEAEELDHWLLSTRATLSSAFQPQNEDLDMEEQLIDCQVRLSLPICPIDGMQVIVVLTRADFVYILFNWKFRKTWIATTALDTVCESLCTIVLSWGSYQKLMWSVWLHHCSRNSAFPWIHSLGIMLLLLFQSRTNC